MNVNVRSEEHILFIEVDRPQKMNALTREMYHGIAQAYGRLDRDPGLRVGLLHARGEHFTSGIDLPDWAGTFAGGQGFPLQEGGIDPFGMSGGIRCRKPVVMAVQGRCYTWGVEMMLNTDIRVAADDTRFAMLEVKRGLFPCGGATLRLPREIGWGNAQRYLLTGDEWSAEQALHWGLVQQLTAPGAQLEAAVDIARRIVAAAPLGVRGVLASARTAVLQGEEAARATIFSDMAELMKSEDMQEGLQSFLERRPARFKGR